MPAREDEIGALWIRESKTSGEKFLAGKLADGTEIIMFKNKHKQPGEKSPDYRIYKSAPRQQQAPAQKPEDLTPPDGMPF